MIGNRYVGGAGETTNVSEALRPEGRATAQTPSRQII
jgi:hypothetical protein